MHDNVITENKFVSVAGDFKTTFELIIRKVNKNDRGVYMCQINTNPMIAKSAALDVQIPPEITNSSDDLVIKLGSPAKLVCHADGIPRPRIIWRREDKRNLKVKDKKGAIKVFDEYTGSTLVVPKVTKEDMGAYLCIANNGVAPSRSKRVYVYVQYAPTARVLGDTNVGFDEGRALRLGIHADGFPIPMVTWYKNGYALSSNDRVSIKEKTNSSRSVTSVLMVNRADRGFEGNYECNITNSFGGIALRIRTYSKINHYSVRRLYRRARDRPFSPL